MHVDEELPKKFSEQLKETPVKYRQGATTFESELMGDYAVNKYPTKVLIDKEGVVRKISAKLSRATIEKYL